MKRVPAKATPRSSTPGCSVQRTSLYLSLSLSLSLLLLRSLTPFFKKISSPPLSIPVAASRRRSRGWRLIRSVLIVSKFESRVRLDRLSPAQPNVLLFRHPNPRPLRLFCYPFELHPTPRCLQKSHTITLTFYFYSPDSPTTPTFSLTPFPAFFFFLPFFSPLSLLRTVLFLERDFLVPSPLFFPPSLKRGG